jgi:hypothetical protein
LTGLKFVCSPPMNPILIQWRWEVRWLPSFADFLVPGYILVSQVLCGGHRSIGSSLERD